MPRRRRHLQHVPPAPGRIEAARAPLLSRTGVNPLTSQGTAAGARLHAGSLKAGAQLLRGVAGAVAAHGQRDAVRMLRAAVQPGACFLAQPPQHLAGHLPAGTELHTRLEFPLLESQRMQALPCIGTMHLGCNMADRDTYPPS